LTRSIEGSFPLRSNGLRCVLLPDKSNPSATLFPKLESVTDGRTSECDPTLSAGLSQDAQRGGVQDIGKFRHAGGQPEEFQALIDVFAYCEVPIGLR